MPGLSTRTRGLTTGPVLRLGLAAGLLAVPAAAAGQQGCQFIEGSGNLQTVDVGTGAVTYVGTPNLLCRDGVRIRADSAIGYQQSNYVQLIGHVRFEDPDRRLTAQNAEYFTTLGRLQAHIGAVLVQKSDSSTVRGAEMIYNRAGDGRARAQLDVFGDRPQARLHVRRDSTAAAGADTLAAAAAAPARTDSTGAPYDIVADRILIEADSYFRGRGDVEITRNDLRAYGDSVEYDQVAGTLRLMSRARMRLEDRDLSADLIIAQMPGDQVREVFAEHHAELASEDIRLRAPRMHVFFDQGTMQRLVAVPFAAPAGVADATGAAPAPPPPTDDDRARPVATSEDFTIVGDSIDVRAPGEVLDRIHAVGSSHAESSARDSLNAPDTPRIARTDWIEGDTIVAQFARAPAPDSAAAAPPDSAKTRYRIEQLTAAGRARTLYRMEPNDSARARGEKHPAIHYVTGETIVLQWDQGEIKAMEVKGQTEGVHVEPAPAAPDSLKALPDSTGVRPDSAGVRAGRDRREPADRTLRAVAAGAVVGDARRARTRRRTRRRA